MASPSQPGLCPLLHQGPPHQGGVGVLSPYHFCILHLESAGTPCGNTGLPPFWAIPPQVTVRVSNILPRLLVQLLLLVVAETMERSVVRGDGSRIMTQESLISTRFQQPCLPAWDSGFPKGAFWFLIRVAPKLLLFWIYFWFSGVFLVLWAIRLLSAAFSLTPCPGCVSSSKTP